MSEVSFNYEDILGTQVSEKDFSNDHYAFSIGPLNFVLPAGIFCEYLTHIDAAALPHSPSHLVGLTNHRGNILPVYNLSIFANATMKVGKNYLLIGEKNSAIILCINDKPKRVSIDNASKKLLANNKNTLPVYFDGCFSESLEIENAIWHRIIPEIFFSRLASNHSL